MRKVWSSKEVADTFTQIAYLRDSIIYFPYRLVDRLLFLDALLKSLVALDIELWFNTYFSLLSTNS